jgi:hypothetical protein
LDRLIDHQPSGTNLFWATDVAMIDHPACDS